MPMITTDTENSLSSSTVEVHGSAGYQRDERPLPPVTKLQNPVDCSEDSTKSFRLSPLPPGPSSGSLSTIYRHLRVSNDLTAMKRNTAAMLM